MTAALVLGIDVGGTKTALALVEPRTGDIAARRSLATPPPGAAGAAFLDVVEAEARSLTAEARGGAVTALGLGLCELVGAGGRIESSHRIGWRGLPVAERLSGLAPCHVESDVRAAALAEARLGAGRPYRQHLYLNVGTGISSSWVVEGAPHRGANGHALVIASARASRRCPACGATHDSVLEDVAGGAGLLARYNAQAAHPIASAREFLERATSDDALASRLLGEAADELASALAMALGMLDPEALIIGGGLGAAAGPYHDAIVRETRARIWSERTRLLPILRASLGPDAGVIGAALAAHRAAGDARPQR